MDFCLFTTLSHYLVRRSCSTFSGFTYLYLLEVYPTTTVQQLEREIMSIPKCIGIEMLIPVGFKVFIWLEDCIKLQLFTT